MREKDGGLTNTESHEIVPPAQPVITIPFLLKPRFKDKDFLHQKYVVEQLSVGQISSEIGSSKDAVRRWLGRFDIPLREPHRNHGRPSQPRFGTKIRHGRSICHHSEEKVIQTIRQLRVEGLSLRKIAATLNTLKIPTKCRGKSWHPEMVSRILVISEEQNRQEQRVTQVHYE